MRCPKAPLHSLTSGIVGKSNLCPHTAAFVRPKTSTIPAILAPLIYKKGIYINSSSRSYTSSTTRPVRNPARSFLNHELYRYKFSRLPHTSVRYCSHRRNMCRYNAEVDTSSVHIEKGREVLPKNVKPLHYHLKLEPNFDNFEYEGEVSIE